MPVLYRHVIAVLTGRPATRDAGTAHRCGTHANRGMKKLRQAGKLGAGRTVVVNGIGGLGSYGVQYARLLGGGATVVAFARSDEKLALATENGAHHTVNTRDKSADEFRMAWDLTGRRNMNSDPFDSTGAEESLALGAAVLAREGAMTCVGLMGQKVVLPLLPFSRTAKGRTWARSGGTTTTSPRCSRSRPRAYIERTRHAGQLGRRQRQPDCARARRHRGSCRHHLRLEIEHLFD